MAALLLFVVLVAAVNAHKNFTVTEEAWFDVEIKDYDGIGEDYRGRFVVAMFGDKCPMTTMNFQSLAKGYKRGSVSLYSYQSKVLPWMRLQRVLWQCLLIFCEVFLLVKFVQENNSIS